MPSGVAEQVVKSAFYKWKPQDIVKDVPEAVTEETVVESTSSKPTTQKTGCPSSFSSSECYNGAVYDTYSWSQTISDIDVTVKVPEGVTTKNLAVSVSPSTISVKIKDSGQILLEGELCKKCKHSDVLWSLTKNKLEMHLEKATEMWWDCFLRSEPRLDLNKIDCSRPFEELSEEAQAKIEELTWNQERRRQGLPTSEELTMQEKLRKAWNAEGSPFSGPYDPNAVVFN